MALREFDVDAQADESSIDTAANADAAPTGDIRFTWDDGTPSQDIVQAAMKALNALIRLESSGSMT